MVSIDHIKTLCSGRIGITEPLARMTTFKIGGPAEIYVEPLDSDEALALVMYFREQELPFVVLGNGSNVLIADEGFRGAAINLEKGFSYVKFEGDAIEAGAGIRLSSFVDFCISHGFAGSEMLAGIPGTLGGALIMNAGAFGGQISDYLTDVTVLREGNILILTKEACGFRYRDSGLRDSITLAARFGFPQGNVEELQRRRKELMLKRNLEQPTNFPNAGCIFKNPEGKHAAKLIDDCGLKGFRVGGAEVSPLHANFIVSADNASARDVLEVINHVRKMVFQQTGIALELEIHLIGFPADVIEPLSDSSTK